MSEPPEPTLSELGETFVGLVRQYGVLVERMTDVLWQMHGHDMSEQEKANVALALEKLTVTAGELAPLLASAPDDDR